MMMLASIFMIATVRGDAGDLYGEYSRPGRHDWRSILGPDKGCRPVRRPTWEGGRDVQVGTVQLLAVLLVVAHGVVWGLGSRWERSGRTAPLRASLHAPLAVRAGYAALVAALLYPAVVVVSPEWGYEGWLNWSSPVDLVLQGAGLGLWGAGMVVGVWAARVLGGYMDVDGVTEDHDLVASGPYRYVRHPVYGSFTAIAAGLALVFRSYLLVGVAVAWLAAAQWWVRAEEALLAAPAGLGDTYRTYRERTGRFLPRPRQLRR
jgi:protein-S-isoprenylcysteine O-methyltransferase Ste14